MSKIYHKIRIIIFFIQILSENQIKSNKIINEIPNNIINLNKNELNISKHYSKFNIISYINKFSINKNFKLRNTGLLDVLDGTVNGLLDNVNQTVDDLLDIIIGDDSNNSTQKDNANTNNDNGNNDSNNNNENEDKDSNNNNENENKDSNNNNNNAPNNNTEEIQDSDKNNNKDTTIDNNKKDENNSINNNSETKQNTEKTKVKITDTSIIIEGKFLSDNPNEAYKMVSSNSIKFFVNNKIVNLITENYSLYIYDTSMQPNKTNKDSYMNLSTCEKELRSYYKIPENESLIIIKMDSKTNESFPTNKVTFSIYSQSGKELDTNICSKIIIEIPIKEDTDLNITKIVIMQNNGIDLTDKGDPFFNNLCVPYDNDDSNGMPFDKRTTLYVNETFCDNNCDLESIETSNESYEAVCNCGKSYAEKAKEKRKKQFIKSIFNSNIFVIRCVKISFEWKRLKNNLGHWVFYIFNLGQIINLGFFLAFSFKSINHLLHLPYSSPPIERKNILNNNLLYHHKFNSQSTKKEYDESDEITNHQIKISRFSCISPSTQNLNENENIYSNHDTINEKEKSDTESNSISEKEKIKKEIKTNKKKEEININSITEDQLESFPYEKAVKYDKRNFGKTYIYSIFHKQSLLNAIFIETKSKFRTIKFATVIIGITLNFGWNAFFFSQSMQNRRYEGDNSIWIRIPKVILACFSSIVCCIILNLISSYDKEFNEMSNKENLTQEKIDKFIKKVKCRLISFYCLLFFFSLFFWYFCTSYCSVYPKYAKPWLIDSLQSLFLAQFSPFIFCILYVGLRLIGIKCELKVFFFISKFLNIFLDTRYKKFLKLC